MKGKALYSYVLACLLAGTGLMWSGCSIDDSETPSVKTDDVEGSQDEEGSIEQDVSLRCYGSNTICYGYGSNLCAIGANNSAGTGYKWCYYSEYVVYPASTCNNTCYNGCDCYKKVANTSSCPSSAAGCTW